MRLVFAVVPPMSKVMRSERPRRRPISLAAMTPPTGPDSIIATGRVRADSGDIAPPLDCMMKNRPRKIFLGQALFQPADIGAGNGADIGIHHGGGDALILPIFADDFVREGDEHATAEGATENAAGFDLMGGVGVCVEKTDGDGFRLAVADAAGRCFPIPEDQVR